MASIKEMLDVAGSLEKAEIFAQQLVKKDASYLLDLGLLYALQGKIEKSWEACQKATKIFPNNDRVAYNRGWHVMLQGNLLEGFTLMNRGRNEEIWGNIPLPTQQPIWNGENLLNKTVLFNCEAGFGDEIAFIRFAQEIAQKGAKIVAVCSRGMAPIFSRIPEISACSVSNSALGIYHDYWMPSMLAPVTLGVEFKDLLGKPYLTANPEYVKKFSTFIKSDKLKVGIRWLGQEGDDYINRIFPLEPFLKAVDQDHVQLYSLQKDHPETNLPKNIIDLDVLIENWEDTAGAIANLDLVISSCTSVAHLAAAMGKETWVIIPLMMYYIWCYPGEKSPWYDSVTLFRQEEYGTWQQPFDKIEKKLRSLK